MLEKELCLPTIRSVNKEIEKVRAEPGETLEQVLSLIKQMIENGETIGDCVMLIDELSIYSKIQVDPKMHHFTGYTTLSGSRVKAPATKALFFMLVSLDGKWRYPVRYELTTSFKGEELVPLVNEILATTFDSKILVRGLVFDGLGSNLTFSNAAGANLDFDNLVNFIKHPCTDMKVYVIPDPVHMLKLARNFIAQIGEVFIPGFLVPVLWRHWIALHDFQVMLGFRLGNRLTEKHIEFENFIMKVRK